jgi:hypothetical protein
MPVDRLPEAQEHAIKTKEAASIGKRPLFLSTAGGAGHGRQRYMKLPAEKGSRPPSISITPPCSPASA